jgi:putative transposase
MSVKLHSKEGFTLDRIYFITFAILGRKEVFDSDKYAKLFYKWFDYQRLHYKNKVHAYVIMPNHFHCIIYISEKSPDIVRLIQNAKMFLAYGIVKLLKENNNTELLEFFASNVKVKSAKHKVFEEGFDCKLIENEQLFLQKLHYIHNNPCQNWWRLVPLPEEYKYSSAGYYFSGKGEYEIDQIDF